MLRSHHTENGLGSPPATTAMPSLASSPAARHFVRDCATAMKACPRGRAALYIGGQTLLDEGAWHLCSGLCAASRHVLSFLLGLSPAPCTALCCYAIFSVGSESVPMHCAMLAQHGTGIRNSGHAALPTSEQLRLLSPGRVAATHCYCRRSIVQCRPHSSSHRGSPAV